MLRYNTSPVLNTRFKKLFIYLRCQERWKDRKSETDNQTTNGCFLITGLGSQMSTIARTGPGQSQNPRTHLESSIWVVKTQALQPLLAAPKAGSVGNNLKQSQDLNPGPATWEVGFSSSLLTRAPSTHPCSLMCVNSSISHKYSRGYHPQSTHILKQT